MWSVQCAVRSVECSGRKCKVYYSVQWGVRSVQCQVWSGSVECKVCSATVQSVQYGMLCGACADKSVDCGVESVECGESGVRSVEYGAWRVVHIYLSNLRSKTLASALALETRKKYQTTTTKFTEVHEARKKVLWSLRTSLWRTSSATPPESLCLCSIPWSAGIC